MTIHARQLCFVEVPHRTGWILDDDAAILAAYADGRRRLPRERALWEARSGRRCAWWSIWDGDTFTGELVRHPDAAAARVLQLLAGRYSICTARS